MVVLVVEAEMYHMPGQGVVDVMVVMVLLHIIVIQMEKVVDLVIKGNLPPTQHLTQKH
tara:strand:+ start:279 stop:452 length:174 start_codon:yes stop_codon:yes gene_type:complete